GSQSTYHGLVNLYLANGQYDAAAAPAAKGVQLEAGAGRASVAFVGAHCLAGFAAARAGNAAVARAHFQHALDSYSDSRHLYAPFMRAMSLVGSGELSRAVGAHDETLVAARRAMTIGEENPRALGT